MNKHRELVALDISLCLWRVHLIEKHQMVRFQVDRLCERHCAVLDAAALFGFGFGAVRA